MLVIVLINQSSNATIRRVGFFASPVSGVDYSSYGSAYTASAAGDTILVFPGVAAIYQVFTKKIITIGPGDWLDPNSTPKGNANYQAQTGVSTLSTITFNAGSEGSVVMGMDGGTVYINANNITIRRNREIAVCLFTSNSSISISNVQLIENYRLNLYNSSANINTVTGLNISNNLINILNVGVGNTYNGNISNNVWAYDATQTATNGGSSTMSGNNSIDLGGGAFLFQNNIFVSYTSSTAGSNYNYYGFSNASNCIFNYNLALQTTNGSSQVWGPGVGNVITPLDNASSIFAAFPAIGTSSADARYQLGASSPALTIGAGGTPIGMFAGTSPYKLSLIPTIPSIYQMSSPQGNNPVGNTIQINFGTRGNN